ncbi:MAG: tRNA pseudouridine(55) synthase TruB [Holosporaceae bacterium]|jgi:tRNA pseudouridine55 synthase|nr:tRNA pseudouridine(55) synthase TruB [Holosporaceae bacterium]
MKNGWICLDKPKGISSNKAMIKLRKILKSNTGYIGTLDPFATGVLPIAIGEARKFIRFLEESEKTYVFEIVFGKTTDTLDKNGIIVNSTSNIPGKNRILEVLGEFEGEIEQIPPVFSAIKINGIRACDRVRKGEVLEIPSRKVNIFAIKMVDEDLEDNSSAIFKVTCSKGTYIRSLARDIAEKLGSLAYVESLKRIKSGFFSIKSAIPLEKLLEIEYTKIIDDFIVPIESPLDDIPALYLESNVIASLKNGLHVFIQDRREIIVSIFDAISRKFCGIGAVFSGGFVKPVRMYFDN